jgi:hypothetical protein
MTLLRQIVHSLSQGVKQHLRQWTQFDNHTLVLSAALDLTSSESELMRENAIPAPLSGLIIFTLVPPI